MTVQRFKPENFEILIIDNNSDYDVTNLVQNFTTQHPEFDIKVIKETRQGEQYAWNKGIESAKGKLLIFTDDDVRFHQDYFATVEKDFPDNLDNIAGGGKIAPVFEYQKPAWINKYVMPYFAEINLGEKTTFSKNKHPFATNMLVSKNIFDIVGTFNTQLMNEKKIIPPGSFERDLFQRIKSINIPVYYFHDLVVWHFIPQEKIDKKYVKERAIENGRTFKEIFKQRSTGWYLYALWTDLLKWIAAMILSIYYIFTTQWEKASMLFKLRWWRSKGLWN
jgi:glycosyltransferase involved in cell wall biosynthesis